MKTRTEAEIRRSLEEGLPLDRVLISEELPSGVADVEGVASWYDYNGVTYGNTVDEQLVIDCWLLEVIGKKVGYEIKRVRELNSGGRCNLWFKRKVA